ncbi:MAG: type II toxin-antitoxin system HicA family toxin [Lachnospiraceae bacterium]|nr:type II toxin-antitoxin system HicA family toxin [Lachnospiraceae bacterium]
MKFREIERLLIEDGWIQKTQRGSHHQYIHPIKHGKVTVPEHSGDIHPDTVRSIMKQAGLKL